jgi:hypothetical protein
MWAVLLCNQTAGMRYADSREQTHWQCSDHMIFCMPDILPSTTLVKTSIDITSET